MAKDDYDLDEDADGVDFLLWQRCSLSESLLNGWNNNFGNRNKLSDSSTSNVPEPNTLIIQLTFMTAMLSTRFLRLTHIPV